MPARALLSDTVATTDSDDDLSRPLRLLVAAHDPTERKQILDLLGQIHGRGYSIECVSAQAEALEALQHKRYDVGLIHEDLADGNGIDVVVEARSLGWLAPLLFLAREVGSEQGRAAMQAGAMDCITPQELRPDLIERAIRYAVWRQEAETALRDSKEELMQQLLDLQDAKDRIEQHGIDAVSLAEDLAQARDELQVALNTAEESERRYRTLAENSPVGIWQISPNGLTHYLNPAMCGLLAVAGIEDMGGETYHAFVDPGTIEIMEGAWRQWLDGTAVSAEVRLRHGTGDETRDVVISGAPLHSVNGDVQSLLTTVVDITERKQVEEAMRHMARHDALTNLPNRALFRDRLDQALRSAHRLETMVAILYLDLDHFKDVNDTLGHAVGDLLLKSVAERLEGCARESDTVARLGGDEFAVIANNVAGADGIAVLAKRIIDALGEPYLLEGQDVHTATSIGITMYPADSDDPDRLLKNADLALYRAKDAGRGRYQFYDPEMDAEVQDRKALEHDLRRALQHDELELYYQPQVDLRRGRVRAAEALLRWHHPKRGMVPPARFVPLAETTGLIVPISEWVLRTACRQAKLWQQEGLPPIRVAVNVSAVQFKKPEFVATVEQILKETGLSPELLELEITESMMMREIDKVADLLSQIDALGIRLSIDDFGTGFSSLSHLRRLPVGGLKIDQSFVRNIVADADDATIARTIIKLGQSLNMWVIAEGVETVEQLSYLQHIECHGAQGYYFSRPVPAADFKRWVREHADAKALQAI